MSFSIFPTILPEVVNQQPRSWSTEFGASSEYFGVADYAAALFPDKRDTPKLQSTRNRILDWLLENPQKLESKDQPGMTEGLYENIKEQKLSNYWGDRSLYSEAPDYFGGADLDASRAAGFSDVQIKDFLDKQDHSNLREKNQPGGGGIYDWLTGTATDDRPDALAAWPSISVANRKVSTSPILPTPKPTVTNVGSDYTTLEGLSISSIAGLHKPTGDSLKWPGGDTMAPKSAKGVSLKTPKRKRYTQTTDLAREARNSLNIS